MTQKQAVLQLFRMCDNVVTTAQFCSFLYPNERGEQVGLASEYRARISNLRSDGYRIEATQMARGRWEYRLLPAQANLFQEVA
jgi:hypothetical protein